MAAPPPPPLPCTETVSPASRTWATRSSNRSGPAGGEADGPSVIPSYVPGSEVPAESATVEDTAPDGDSSSRRARGSGIGDLCRA
ncbi:MAG TPA: hypothetical protein VF657_13660 [Actinoplanes sp.]